ncbi:MAG TPA: MarR family transcriptional regulator [Vineibacter sp.]|nr:MarR family transcriptional regulator [Vineibacter sp.]
MPPTPPAATLALERFLPYRLSILSQLVSGSIHDQYFEPSGLSIPQWRVMAVLGRFAPLSAGEVGERTLLDKVTVSRAVAALLDRRLIARATDSDDRRKSALILTGEGRRLHGHVAGLALDYEARLLNGLTHAEQRTLDLLLHKLTRHVRSLRPDANGT